MMKVAYIADEPKGRMQIKGENHHPNGNVLDEFGGGMDYYLVSKAITVINMKYCYLVNM